MPLWGQRLKRRVPLATYYEVGRCRLTLSNPPPGNDRLKLKFDKLLSNFAFNFNLRRYYEVSPCGHCPHHEAPRVVNALMRAWVAAVAAGAPPPDVPVAAGAGVDGRTTRAAGRTVVGRGLHLSTYRIKVSTFCGIRWVHDSPSLLDRGTRRGVTKPA